MELARGIEPPTCGLQNRYTATKYFNKAECRGLILPTTCGQPSRLLCVNLLVR